MRQCPQCTKPNADDKAACLYCGASLDGPRAAAAPRNPPPKFEIVQPPAAPPSKAPRMIGMVVGGAVALLILASMAFKMMGGSYQDPRVPTFNVAPFVDQAAYREAFEDPYVEGKLLFVHAWSSFIDPDLPKHCPPERIARSEGEVGTIIWLRNSYDNVGEYRDVKSGEKESDAFKGKTEISIVNVRTKTILCRKTFEGHDPAGLKRSGESSLGDLARGEILRYVLDLPRR
jgi:hypothetical protein